MAADERVVEGESCGYRKSASGDREDFAVIRAGGRTLFETRLPAWDVNWHSWGSIWSYGGLDTIVLKFFFELYRTGRVP